MTELLALLKLCDDPSPVVAHKVARRLRELDARQADSESNRGVWDQIAAQGISVSPAQRAALDEILADSDEESTQSQNAQLQDESEQKLRAVWSDIFRANDENHEEAHILESALLSLCDWQSGAGSGARGRILLDELALQFGDFEAANQITDAALPLDEAMALSKFLFEFKPLRGAPADDYYNPEQSNLTRVLESGHGLPITLTCIFILVGRRIGLTIQGCSFPGHFLARDTQNGRVFDPFNGGRVLSAREVASLQKAAPDEMNSAAPAREIAARVLRNLSVAYYQSGEAEKSALMLSLLQSMDADSSRN